MTRLPPISEELESQLIPEELQLLNRGIRLDSDLEFVVDVMEAVSKWGKLFVSTFLGYCIAIILLQDTLTANDYVGDVIKHLIVLVVPFMTWAGFRLYDADKLSKSDEWIDLLEKINDCKNAD